MAVPVEALIKAIFEIGPSPSMIAARLRISTAAVKGAIVASEPARNAYGAKVTAVIDAIRIFGVDTTSIADYLGVDRSTVWAWMSENPHIRRAYDNARAAIVDLAEKQFASAIAAGKPWAIQLALMNSAEGARRGYGARVKIDLAEESERLGVDLDHVVQRLADELLDDTGALTLRED